MEHLRLALLAAGLLCAAWIDCKGRKIPNWLTASMALSGLVLSACIGGLQGLRASLLGFLAGLLGGMALWVLGTFKAGDAKLFAALGAMMGGWWLLDCFCWALMTGAVCGVLFLAWKGRLMGRLRRVWTYLKYLILSRSFEPYTGEEGSEGEMPFAVFVALGGLLAYFLPLWR